MIGLSEAFLWQRFAAAALLFYSFEGSKALLAPPSMPRLWGSSSSSWENVHLEDAAAAVEAIEAVFEPLRVLFLVTTPSRSCLGQGWQIEFPQKSS